MPQIVVESPERARQEFDEGAVRLHTEVFHSFHNEVGDEVWT